MSSFEYSYLVKHLSEKLILWQKKLTSTKSKKSTPILGPYNDPYKGFLALEWSIYNEKESGKVYIFFFTIFLLGHVNMFEKSLKKRQNIKWKKIYIKSYTE